jgi:hypothetical protein
VGRTAVGRVFRVCLGSAALAIVVSCGGSTHGSGGADAGPDVGVSAEAAINEDAAACFIEATSYDQSCSVDSDCVGQVNVFSGALPNEIQVTFGNFCKDMCLCGPGAINSKAAQQYVADVTKTPLVRGAVPYEGCYCAPAGSLCCENGLCSSQCILYAPIDAGSPVEQDAQGASTSGDAGVLCGCQG